MTKDTATEHASNAAVGTHGLGERLLRLVPGAGLAHVVLALEHQGARRTHTDAVAAVHARGFGKLDGELGRNVRVETTTGNTNRKGVLRIDPAGLDALVAKDAAGVIAHVEVVVDLHGL